jgi:hypothetical protein
MAGIQGRHSRQAFSKINYDVIWRVSSIKYSIQMDKVVMQFVQ